MCSNESEPVVMIMAWVDQSIPIFRSILPRKKSIVSNIFHWHNTLIFLTAWHIRSRWVLLYYIPSSIAFHAFVLTVRIPRSGGRLRAFCVPNIPRSIFHSWQEIHYNNRLDNEWDWEEKRRTEGRRILSLSQVMLHHLIQNPHKTMPRHSLLFYPPH